MPRAATPSYRESTNREDVVRLRLIPPVLLATVGLLLAGCAAAPENAPTSTPTVTTPTVEPEAPAELTTVVLSSANVALVFDDGTREEFDYFSPSVDPIVSALEGALGTDVEPVVQDGGDHPDQIIYDFGGLAVRTQEAAGSYPNQITFRIVVTAAAVGGVNVETTEGVSVGDTGASVAAFSYRDYVDEGGTETTHFYRIDQLVVEEDVQPDYEPAAFAVRVWASYPDEIVTRLDAPSPNWGA